MDIVSFVMGLQKGKASAPEMQEKTVKITENGTTEVLPDDGCALSKVTVDVSIVSSGGKSYSYKRDSASSIDSEWSLSNGVLTYKHNLGVVPDFLFFGLAEPVTTTGNTYLLNAYGFNDAMLEALGGGYICMANLVYASGGVGGFGSNVGIEHDAIDSLRGQNLRNVTATTFTVGSSTYPIMDKTYMWIALYGIT